MKAYHTPGTVNDDHRHVGAFVGKEPKVSNIQLEATRKKAIPDAGKYAATHNWSKP